MKPRGVDHPVSLALAHSRIDAYRYALDLALDAMSEAWKNRIPTGPRDELLRAIKRAEAELAVTTRIRDGDNG